MCEQVPSTTIWGTTQVVFPTTTISTLTTLVPGEPLTFVITSIDANDGQASIGAVTTTPYETSIVTSRIGVMETMTSLVPQKTLYYPCPTTATFSSTASASASSEGSMSSDSPSTITMGQAGPTETMTTSSSGPAQQSTVRGGDLTGQSTGTLSKSSSSIFASSEPATSTPNGHPWSSIAPTPTSTEATHASSGATPASSSLSETSPHSESHKSATIAGGIIGAILGLILLVLLAIYGRRKSGGGLIRSSRRRSGKEGEDVAGDYWEARFRELEAETEGGGRAEKGDGFGGEVTGEGRAGEWDLSSSQKLHLTLNLESNTLPARPPSRLSTVSTFFSNALSPLPTRRSIRDSIGAGRTKVFGTAKGTGLNFSRPLRRIPLTPSQSGLMSMSASPSTIGSVDDTGSTQRESKASIGPRSPRRTSTGSKSNKRISPFILPSMREERERTVPAESDESPIVPRKGEETRVERNGMEWMRSFHPRADGEEQVNADWIFPDGVHPGPGTQSSTMFTGSVPSVSGGLRPPRRPPRARVVDAPLATLRRSPSSASDVSSRHDLHLQPGDGLTGVRGPDATSLRGDETTNESVRTRSRAGRKSSRSLYSPTLKPTTLSSPQMDATSSNRALTPSQTLNRGSNSMRRTLESKGIRVPELNLSREALTPSLWLDDDLLARFEGERGGGTTGLVSQFSTTTSENYLANATVEGDEAFAGLVDDEVKMNFPRNDQQDGPSPPSQHLREARAESINSAELIDRPPSTDGSICSSAEEVEMTEIRNVDRSAVTPQLPMMTLGSSRLSEWGIGDNMNPTGEQ
ncbi:hypothetical protein IAR55_004401 [Kwoniella newhampshirensis]|uniref:Fibronectin type-III domain-containing protein n=1 Tax=Kwoniella newhampshirensis TaxID=1651941 RepID=A0AAW0YND3_9TREE